MMEMKTAARPPILHTARLALRPFIAEDENAVVDLLTDPAIARTYILPDFPDRQEAVGLFDKLLVFSNRPERFVYGIYLQGRVIGFINDVLISEEEIELGYVIAPAHWNRGYATEALSACIEALFALGFGRVICGYFDGNEASRRVMEKCGMTPTGVTETIRYRGRDRLCVYRAIRNTAPVQAPAAPPAYMEEK